MRIAPAITLSSDQQTTLGQWARSRSLPARVVERARIVLLAAQGRQDREIARAMKITAKKASRWRRRFLCSSSKSSAYKKAVVHCSKVTTVEFSSLDFPNFRQGFGLSNALR